MQDIDDVANEALNEIQQRESSYADIETLRDEYNALAQHLDRVVHQQLDAIYALQEKIKEKSNQLQNLSELLRDYVNLDAKLQSRLIPLISYQIPTPTTDSQPLSRIFSSLAEVPSVIGTEESGPSTTLTNDLINPILMVHTMLNPSPRTEDTEQAANSTEQGESLDLEAGLTANIQRENPIRIPTTGDECVGTLCCHNNQLLYSSYNPRNESYQLTLFHNIENLSMQQVIAWPEPDRSISGDDNNWIQDITYSIKLDGYLLLNRSRLRFLASRQTQLEEFSEFHNRTMKRITCNDSYIYLLSTTGIPNNNGDEIIIMNYDKEEKACKTLRDIMSNGRDDPAGVSRGEITDLAINSNGYLLIAFRVTPRKQIRLCTFNISDDLNDWSLVKQLSLNECWDNEISYTPRMEWCEKFLVFILVEYKTGHLIMLDQNGQVKGECIFKNNQNRGDSPLNIAVSNSDWFCVRYELSINIHRLENDRL